MQNEQCCHINWKSYLKKKRISIHRKKIESALNDKGINTLTLTVKSNPTQSELKKLITEKIIIVISPVYIDAPPSGLLKTMKDTYTLYDSIKTSLDDNKRYIFGISNCGFYEPIHTRCVLNIIEQFGRKIGRVYSGGIGIGCGQLLTSFNTVPIIDSYLKGPVEKSINELINHIEKLYKEEEPKAQGTNKFVNFRISKLIYKIITYFYWYSLGRKNGLKLKDFYYCPYGR